VVKWRIPHPRKGLSRYLSGDEKYLTAAPGERPIDDTAAQLRRIVDTLSRTDPSGSQLPSATDRLRLIADELDHYAESLPDRLYGMWEGEGIVRHDPVTGPENALAPPLVMEVTDDGWVHGELVLGLPYQGPPATVHGGICAALLDAALAVANRRAGHTGMTARLTVEYKRPTPLFTPITVRAKQISTSGRKRYTVGEIIVHGFVTVRADGLFIARK